MSQSPEIAGGAGFTFEDAPVAIYLGALLGEESAPGLEDRTVVRVAVQQAAYSEPLDDLIVDGRGADESMGRLSLQTKRELTISAATTNTDFREIVTRAWATLQNGRFRENVDRVGAITGTVSETARRALVTICEWARASNTLETFLGRFQPGVSGADKRNALQALRDILGDDDGTPSDAKTYRLLRHFVLIKVDVLHEGATDDAHAIERLRHHLHDAARAGDLWQRLLRIAREAAGRAQEFSRLSLLASLRGGFRLAVSRAIVSVTFCEDTTAAAWPFFTRSPWRTMMSRTVTGNSAATTPGSPSTRPSLCRYNRPPKAKFASQTAKMATPEMYTHRITARRCARG
jgi:hypothetical protein